MVIPVIRVLSAGSLPRSPHLETRDVSQLPSVAKRSERGRDVVSVVLQSVKARPFPGPFLWAVPAACQELSAAAGVMVVMEPGPPRLSTAGGVGPVDLACAVAAVVTELGPRRPSTAGGLDPVDPAWAAAELPRPVDAVASAGIAQE